MRTDTATVAELDQFDSLLDVRSPSEFAEDRSPGAVNLPVLDDDAPETLAARVQAVERELVPEAIRLFAEGRLRIEGRRVRIAR